MSVVAYQTTQLHTASPLTVEIMAFQKITGALERAQADAAQDLSAQPLLSTQRHVRLCDAVHQNSRLWLTLLEDLANPANGLPSDLKARLGSLAVTSVRHGQRVVAGQATLGLLIDINRAIAAGLMQARANAAKSAAAAQEVRYASGQA
ncbi:MAG TPA: flagellar biosynthesis regulator FlaF [Candidatus Acidoferrum sp.]|nr:flagellar biosynthesis regulator FlaF [Candidatus Acidoferrum sp.]